MKTPCYFYRSVLIKNLYEMAILEFDLKKSYFDIPYDVISKPHKLVPLPDIEHFYRQLADCKKADKQDPMLMLAQKYNVIPLGHLKNWLLSGQDVSMSIMRLANMLKLIQSNAQSQVVIVKDQIGWRIHIKGVAIDVIQYESVRAAIGMLNILRYFFGESFTPNKLCLSGYCHERDEKQYRDLFQCDIQWHQPRTEIWFNRAMAFSKSSVVFEDSYRNYQMGVDDLDRYFNMPDPLNKVQGIISTIAYQRHYRLPRLVDVAQKWGWSDQQLSRFLRDKQVSFTQLRSLVLANEAITMLQKGIDIEQVRHRLGYENQVSFTNMFKSMKGMTPKQYQQRFVSER
ncbi:AraC family transcriptional regulator [Thalassotalea sp. HSM 43]|uniref:AraC family transcriptional regulator n=1 Tax=Thalassotalea sp. HSM 43 TaxID=2552945 RepID=UPI00108193BE|nr:AraC family transcriptional regulator [Thalassotalea sp. HSM 43]QBY06013.1 AraC family transcriptional regulator [Thalassotalea sp. HSM 43]